MEHTHKTGAVSPAPDPLKELLRVAEAMASNARAARYMDVAEPLHAAPDGEA